MSKSYSEMTDEEREAEELNTRAYLAMSRISAGVVERLVELLRSDAPIHPMMRSAMADAFEGKSQYDRVTFKIVGQKDGALGDWAERRHKFHRDMVIARYIEELRNPPRELTLAKASEAAADHFSAENLTPRTCAAAVEKALAFKRWQARFCRSRRAFFAAFEEDRYQLALEIEYFDAVEAGRDNDTPWFTHFEK